MNLVKKHFATDIKPYLTPFCDTWVTPSLSLPGLQVGKPISTLLFVGILEVMSHGADFTAMTDGNKDKVCWEWVRDVRKKLLLLPGSILGGLLYISTVVAAKAVVFEWHFPAATIMNPNGL